MGTRTEGLKMSASNYWQLADALAIKIDIDVDQALFEAYGEVYADFGLFPAKLDLLGVSYTLDIVTGDLSFILAASPGDLALYVEYRMIEREIKVCVLDASKLPKGGVDLFEDQTVLDLLSGRAVLFEALGITSLAAHRLEDNQTQWSAGCI
jgi:hypothetical protein